MNAVKFITCEKHQGRRVWHPLGAPCPACHPELYPPCQGQEPSPCKCALVVLEDDQRQVAAMRAAAQMARDLLADIHEARVGEIVTVKQALEKALGKTCQPKHRRTAHRAGVRA